MSRLFVVGAGLWGCLTAYKLAKKYPKKKIILIENSNKILSSYNHINLGKKNLNNGFHGIEFPRGLDLLNFLKIEFKLKFYERENERHLLIDKFLVRENFSKNNVSKGLSKFYLKNKLVAKNQNTFLKNIDKNLKNYFIKISQRYSKNFTDVSHLFIPWFFPKEYSLKNESLYKTNETTDEGAEYRDLVKANKIKAYYAFPKKFLFSSMRKPIYQKLKKIKNIQILFNSKIKFIKNGILLNKEKIDLKKNFEPFYFCLSPIILLKDLYPKNLYKLMDNPKFFVTALVKTKKDISKNNFTEIICCNKKLPELTRISKITNTGNGKYLLLELVLNSSNKKKLELLRKKIIKNFNLIFYGSNKNFIEIEEIKITRKIFFPSKISRQLANNKINFFTKNNKNIYFKTFFGPINMSKAWNYSDDYIKNYKKNYV